MMSLIGVVNTFGRVRALDGRDMQVNAGAVRGFLGPVVSVL